MGKRIYEDLNLLGKFKGLCCIPFALRIVRAHFAAATAGAPSLVFVAELRCGVRRCRRCLWRGGARIFYRSH